MYVVFVFRGLFYCGYDWLVNGIRLYVLWYDRYVNILLFGLEFCLWMLIS